MLPAVPPVLSVRIFAGITRIRFYAKARHAARDIPRKCSSRRGPRAALTVPRSLYRPCPCYSFGFALFYILEGIIALLAGAHLDDILHIIDKDFAVADMPGVQYLFAVSMTAETGTLLTTMST